MIRAHDDMDIADLPNHLSTTNFTAAYLHLAGKFMGRDEFLETVKSGWTLREKQRIDTLERKVYPLTSALAIANELGHSYITYKYGTEYEGLHALTITWQREMTGWRVIQYHESSKANDTPGK